MRKVYLLLLLLTSLLSGDPATKVNSSENFISGSQESLATAMGCVNVFTGTFFQVDNDLVVEGPEPLSFTRTYDSRHLLDSVYGFGFGTQFSLRIRSFGKGKEHHHTALETQEGSYLEFKEPSFSNKGDSIYFHLDPKILDHGLTNYSGEGISAHTNSGRIKIHFDGSKMWKVRHPNGREKLYKSINLHSYFGAESGAILAEERHPSGNKTAFKYDARVQDLTLLSGFQKAYNINPEGKELNSISLSYTKDGYQVKGSNGQSVNYKTENEIRSFNAGFFSPTYTVKSIFLKEVSAPHLPTTKYHIDETGKKGGFCKIGKVEKPDGRILEISYEKGKVSTLKAPIGKTKELLTAASFEYANNMTTVTNALGNKTIYRYSKEKRIKGISRHLSDKLYSSKFFFWDTLSGWLVFKADSESKGQLKRGVKLSYDRKGNVTSEWFLGNLTGNGPGTFTYENGEIGGHPEVWVRHYTYSNDGFNLKLSEWDDSGLKIEYKYKPGTNLLIQRTSWHHDKIQEKISHTYDENAILIKTVDGRKITEITPINDLAHPAFGKPAEIKEGYEDPESGYQLLRITKFSYSNHGYLSRKETAGSSDTLCYSETYEYDERDLCTRETDPLGRETTYEYDANHNKIVEEKAGKKTHYAYDFMNRLIQVKEVFDDGVIFKTDHEYDLVGNRLSTTDHFGNKTRYVYDALNRLIETHDSLGSVRKQKFDHLDRIISITDANGHETTTSYNAYDKPIQITHPDGTTEKFEYTKGGWLLRHTDQEGVKKEYAHDPEGRVIKESLFDKENNLIERITRCFKGRHLISESDFAGNLTEYKFDPAGRKIEEKKGDRIITFTYDPLGRLRSTVRGDQVEITEYDFLDRPVEERLEDITGALFKKVTYEYDRNGNKTAIHTHIDENTIATEQILYNLRNEPILKIDAAGYQTEITYDYKSKGLQRTTKDPNGILTIEAFDPLQRLVSTIKKDTKTLSHQELFYDAAGHKIKQINHLYPLLRDYTIEWSYDRIGRLKTLTEQDDKVTHYTYTPTGRLKTLTKPDRVVLTHTYTPNGLLKTLSSSDKSIDYTTLYDTNHNPIKISGATKSYNIHNELIQETLTNGLTTTYAYDSLGRLTSLILPDKSTIEYHYDAFNLITVLRKELYQETYENFDLQGRARRSNLSSIDYTWDKMGRRVAAKSPHWSETLDLFDAKGNLLNWSIQDEQGPLTTTFTYDPLDQLASENEHTYRHDSLCNRLQKDKQSYTLNKLNQYESDDKATYKYDPNGNLIEKIGQQTLTYDALNRLTSVTTSNGKISYTYDATGRCLTRQVTKNGKTTTLSFHYQFDQEIGAIGKNHQQLRILGLSRRSKIGQTLAVELDHIPYFVISDHLGSIRALVGSSGVQTYRYTAFGERQTSSSLDCPWGFNNKRLDSDTGYLRFPKRDYCPDLGRWLTPDPLNFDDGPNLYAYVKNNPLMFEDPYGLFMTSTFNPSYKQGFSTSFQRGFFNPYETMKQPTSLPFKIAANDHDAVFNHLMDRSLQLGEYTGAMAGVATGLALNYGIGKAGYSLAGKLAKPFFNGVSRVLPNIGRAITGEVAGGGADAVIGGAYNRAAHELYKAGLRSQMNSPHTSNPILKSILSDAYRPNGLVGNGSTAAAIRHELKLGTQIKGKWHSQKGKDLICRLEKWQKNNPTETPGNRAAAENVLIDLYSSFGN